MRSDLTSAMKRFFASPAPGGRKLQRRSGPPTSLEGPLFACPEDLDAPMRYTQGKALHSDFWPDSVRPAGYKYPNGPEARILIPVLGMCGAGKTCLINHLQEGYWGGAQGASNNSTTDDGFPAGQTYSCEGTIYKLSTPEIPPRSQLNGMLEQYTRQNLSIAILITYSVTWRESFIVACRLFDELRAGLTRAKLPVLVMLMGLRKDRDTQRQVTRAEAEAFAKQRGILFAETSAMTGRGVRGAFGLIVEAVHKHGSTLPKGISGSSLVDRLRLDLLKNEIFRLGLDCFEQTKDRKCPSYQSKWDPGTRPPPNFI